MLLTWGETTVLGHLIARWQRLSEEPTSLPGPLPARSSRGEGEAAVRQVAVVSAEYDAAIGEELDRLGFPADQRILNPDTERGMFSSIQCAARWNGWQAELTHWILVLGDQPHLSEGTLHRLLDFVAEHAGEVCQPIYRGHRRHPVVMPKKVFRELANSTAHDLKQFLALFAGATCKVDDPGLELDMDVPEDYERARRIYGGK